MNFIIIKYVMKLSLGIFIFLEIFRFSKREVILIIKILEVNVGVNYILASYYYIRIFQIQIRNLSGS